MDFQTLLPILVGFISSALSLLAGKFLPKLLDSKYYVLVSKLYPVLDPILADNIKMYGESEIRTIIKEVALSISDGQLTAGEATKVVDMFLKEFNIAKASSAPANASSNLVLDAIETVDSISQLDLSGIKLTLK